jgi:hypothetical protein
MYSAHFPIPASELPLVQNVIPDFPGMELKEVEHVDLAGYKYCMLHLAYDNVRDLYDLGRSVSNQQEEGLQQV